MTVLQNEVSEWISRGFTDNQTTEAVDWAIKQLRFVVANQAVPSKWWNSAGAGAVSVRGVFEGKPALLKLQLVKPTTRESVMMEQFARAFHGSGIRPPHVFAILPASEWVQGEVIVMEDVSSFQVVSSASSDQGSIERFMDGYRQYHEVLGRIMPWVDVPIGDAATRITASFARFRTIRQTLYPAGNWLTKEDEALLDQGISLLVRVYATIPLTFMHGHFSARDMYAVGDELVLLSNLYWSWRPPLYDLVFGFHWRRIDVASQASEVITREREWWQTAMEKQIGVGEKRWYLAALLERSLAALLMDGASLFQQHPEYLSLIRQEIISLQTQIAAA